MLQTMKMLVPGITLPSMSVSAEMRPIKTPPKTAATGIRLFSTLKTES